MHLNSRLIPSFLIASVSLAAFIPAQRATVQTLGKTPPVTVIATNTVAGAAFSLDNGTFSHVSGTVTMPDISGPEGRKFSMAVGMDALICNAGFLSAGVEATMTTYEPEYKAWYKNPAGIYYFDISISAGDRVSIVVESTSSNSGRVSVRNEDNDECDDWNGHLDKDFCRGEVDWFIAVAPGQRFPDFDTVRFTQAKGLGQNGQSYGPEHANYNFEILAFNGTAITSVATPGEDSLTIEEL